MSSSVLLIYPRYTYPRKNPPLGLAYLASYIRGRGYEPVIVDLNVDASSDAELKTLLGEHQPIAVGISFMTNQYGEALRLARLIKSEQGGVAVVAGGPHVSALPVETLEECAAIDYIVVGEGEMVFAELLDCIGGGGDASAVAGVCYRADGDIVLNPRRELIADLDSLPFPAWDILKPEAYSVHSIDGSKPHAVLSSRGCPNQCVFCDSHTIFGHTFRGRSAENIFEELKLLHRNYGMTSFDFVDDLITVDKKRILKLCKFIKASDVPYTWMANARVNTVDREMLTTMKSSGCIRIDVGVESGNPQVRHAMKKGITDEQIIACHSMAREIGIQVGTFTMVGNMNETFESVRMTADLLGDISDDVMVSIACPFPGTELYRIAREEGYLKIKDWSRYVTSPTYCKDYSPVMVTDEMDAGEILNAYYYLHSRFAKKKFQSRYGKYFMLNPAFVKNWLFKSKAQGGIARKAGMLYSLLKSRL